MIRIEKMDEVAKNRKYPPTPAQWQAISIVGSDILVSAAAGSGKTEVLSERIARKVAKERWDIDKVLVLTFTTAAAKNMLDRIENKISERLLATGLEEDTMFLRKQRMLMNDANVSTIDSFCLNILRKFYYLVEEEIDGEKNYLSPNFKILPNSKELLVSSINEVLESYYTKNRHYLDLLFTIFGKKEEIIKSLSNIYTKLLIIPNFESYLEEDFLRDNDELLSVFDFTKMDIVRRFGSVSDLTTKENILLAKEFALFLKDEIQDIKEEDFAAKILQAARVSDEKKEKIKNLFIEEKQSLFISLEESEVLAEQIATLDRELEKGDSIFDAGRLAGVYEVLRNYYSIYYFADVLNDVAAAYKSVLLDIHKEFIKKKREGNFLDFSDLNHLAIKALELEEEGVKKPSVAAEYYRNHFLEIYVDEYQDNNDLQEYILNLIKGDDVHFFRVGDVKQAIYGFRGSNPDLFEEKYNSYEKLNIDNYDINKDYEFSSSEEGVCVVLKENFRSKENVLSSSNYVFNRLMKNRNAGISYDKESALYYPKTKSLKWRSKKLRRENRVLIFEKRALRETTLISGNTNYFTKSVRDKDARSQMIENIAYEILNGVNNGNKYSDYAILVRNSTKMSSYKEIFKQYNIPLFFREKEGFTASNCFNILYNVFRFLDNTTRDTSLIAILHSEIFDYSNNHLFELSLLEGDTLFEKLVNSEEVKDKETVNLLNKWLNYSLNNSISSLLEKIVSDIDFVNYLVTTDVSDEEVDYYENFITVVSDYEALDYRLSNFVKYLKNIKDEEVFETKKRTPNNSVTLSTIHISKGLEYKYVFVADLDTKFSKRGYSSEVLFTREFGLSFDAENIAKSYNIENISLEYFSKLQKINSMLIKLREREEEVRNLYVALTRAKEVLYLASPEGIKLNDDKSEEASLAQAMLEEDSFEDVLNILLSTYEEKNEEKASFLLHKNEQLQEKNEVLFEDFARKTTFNIQDFYKDFSKKSSTKNSETTQKGSKNKIFPAKTSYSALKKINGDYKINTDKDKKKQYLELATLSKTTSTTKAIMRGNIVHKLFERIVNDTKRGVEIDDVVSYVEHLVRSGDFITDIKERRILTKEEFEVINNKDDFEKISNFVNSEVISLVKNSKFAQTEVAFTTSKKASELYKDSTSEVGVILQGVVDLLIEVDDDEWIIIDYKTDNVMLKNGEEILKQRHSDQLRIYKEAVEAYYNKENIETYIYSYKLSKLVR